MHQAKTQKDRADDFFTISFFPPPLYYSTLTFHLLHLISASYVCFLVSFFFLLRFISTQAGRARKLEMDNKKNGARERKRKHAGAATKHFSYDNYSTRPRRHVFSGEGRALMIPRLEISILE